MRRRSYTLEALRRDTERERRETRQTLILCVLLVAAVAAVICLHLR